MNLQIKLLVFLSLIVCSNSFAQDTTKQFHSLFEEIEPDGLHIYSFARVPAIFPSTSTYVYKGLRVDTSFHTIIEDVLYPNHPSGMEYTEFFATYRFYISNKLEALLIREFKAGGREHHIHYLVYDNMNEKLVDSQTLSYAYGYEGGEGLRESWILDLNKDGQRDIVTRSSSTYTGNEYSHTHDSLLLSIWSDGELLKIGIADTLLKKQFEEDFPYYKKTFLGIHTEENLVDYLEKETKIKVQENNYPYRYWSIIAGSDKDLESAKHELRRAEEIFREDSKYGLNWVQFEILKKNDRYYTIIKEFTTEVEARIALLEIQKKFNKTAYILNLDEWCGTLDKEKSRHRYSECLD
ncbi:MAG: hypothetical protein ACPG5P_00940 [Saprospiraceae bacterium]